MPKFHPTNGDICAYNKGVHDSRRINTFNTPGKLKWKKNSEPLSQRAASLGARRPRSRALPRSRVWTEEMSMLIRRVYEVMDDLRFRLEDESESPSPTARRFEPMAAQPGMRMEPLATPASPLEPLSVGPPRGPCRMDYPPSPAAAREEPSTPAPPKRPQAAGLEKKLGSEWDTVFSDLRAHQCKKLQQYLAEALSKVEQSPLRCTEPLSSAEPRVFEPSATVREPVAVVPEPVASATEPVTLLRAAAKRPITPRQASYFENLTLLARISRQLTEKIQARVSLYGVPLDDEAILSPRLPTSPAHDPFPNLWQFYDTTDRLGPRSSPDGEVDRFELEDAFRRLDIHIMPQEIDQLVSSPVSLGLLQQTMEQAAAGRRFRSYKPPPRAPTLSEPLREPPASERAGLKFYTEGLGSRV